MHRTEPASYPLGAQSTVPQKGSSINIGLLSSGIMRDKFAGITHPIFLGGSPLNTDTNPPPPFFFQDRSGPINFREINRLDIPKIIREVDLRTLEIYIANLTFSHLRTNDLETFGDDAFIKSFKLSQLIMEYLVYSQEYLGKYVKNLDLQNKALIKNTRRFERKAREYERQIIKLKKEYKSQGKALKTYEYMLKQPSNRSNITYPCSICRHKVFVSEEFLEEHFRRRHPNESMFQSSQELGESPDLKRRNIDYEHPNSPRTSHQQKYRDSPHMHQRSHETRETANFSKGHEETLREVNKIVSSVERSLQQRIQTEIEAFRTSQNEQPLRGSVKMQGQDIRHSASLDRDIEAIVKEKMREEMSKVNKGGGKEGGITEGQVKNIFEQQFRLVMSTELKKERERMQKGEHGGGAKYTNPIYEDGDDSRHAASGTRGGGNREEKSREPGRSPPQKEKVQKVANYKNESVNAPPKTGQTETQSKVSVDHVVDYTEPEEHHRLHQSTHQKSSGISYTTKSKPHQNDTNMTVIPKREKFYPKYSIEWKFSQISDLETYYCHDEKEIEIYERRMNSIIEERTREMFMKLSIPQKLVQHGTMDLTTADSLLNKISQSRSNSMLLRKVSETDAKIKEILQKNPNIKWKETIDNEDISDSEQRSGHRGTQEHGIQSLKGRGTKEQSPDKRGADKSKNMWERRNPQGMHDPPQSHGSINKQSKRSTHHASVRKPQPFDHRGAIKTAAMTNILKIAEGESESEEEEYVVSGGNQKANYGPKKGQHQNGHSDDDEFY